MIIYLKNLKCRYIISKKCRCGRMEKSVPCSSEFLCEYKCNKMKSCGKHKCIYFKRKFFCFEFNLNKIHFKATKNAVTEAVEHAIISVTNCCHAEIINA